MPTGIQGDWDTKNIINVGCRDTDIFGYWDTKNKLNVGYRETRIKEQMETM